MTVNLYEQYAPGKFLQPKEGELTAYRESDHTIVLGDGRADHMGKGVTGLCSLQRKHGPAKKGRVNMQTSLRGGGRVTGRPTVTTSSNTKSNLG